jgi:hypothetical protein
MPCVACQELGVHAQPLPTEAHHLNAGGRAGQKRRGPEFSVPLCGWHHRGVPLGKVPANLMAAVYGPSLARQSKAFRARFGDDDHLLELTNKRMKP